MLNPFFNAKFKKMQKTVTLKKFSDNRIFHRTFINLYGMPLNNKLHFSLHIELSMLGFIIPTTEGWGILICHNIYNTQKEASRTL